MMARYIDAEMLEREIKLEASDDIAKAVIRIIDRQPTADVVEVVRCKDCKWAEQVMIGQCVNWICKCPWMFERYVRDGFCSCGERRDT